MRVRRRLGTFLVVVGLTVAATPWLQEAYSAYSQWQMQRQWDAAVRQESKQSTERPASSSTVGVLEQFFSIRIAEAATGPSRAVRNPDRFARDARGSNRRIHSITSRARATQRYRYMAVPLGLVRLEIPRLGVTAFVVDGTSNGQLARGPAHFSGTALPGRPGNCAIAAHRNVYGCWFRDLNRLRPGDLIVLRTPRQAFTYRVTRATIVRSNDLSILRPTPGPTVTLVTCMLPRAQNRLVVYGRML